MKLAFALEYSLGHVTHAENLKRTLAGDASVTPVYIDLPFHNTPGRFSRPPGVRSNWSVRASLAAYLALKPQVDRLQGALFHTQVTSLFSTGLMRRLPSVISLDATPLQYDSMGDWYGHTPGANRGIEAWKMKLNRRAFAAARHLVTWSEWTKRSLEMDYEVSSSKVTVIPPGIDTERWCFERPESASGKPLKLLFVGGDFARKGGPILLEAFRRLPTSVNAELHLVTPAAEAESDWPGVYVHRNMKPNSDALLAAYQQADIFVFPTLADCLPLAIMEAMSAGLPIITTHVGALSEAVQDGETGCIIPAGSSEALAEAIGALAADPALRAKMSRNARQTARERFDSKTNYHRLVACLKQVAR